ncbi:hypothetical protein JD79_02251 [Geodermatophilus normandii]|uniref:Poly(3-hydroxyalkanoate) polymerase subunit PhaE n=1 Tax=Geodermatophilus normandii TaxID=1137989 RepID=A0A317QK34_9ACTN|nr:hypothetical protein [Geodermatophilus normandii]PWW23086.1 hypothetical protein JD79_02251 [Geodermatophilus normandii]
MAAQTPPGTPLWRQAFDAAEKRVTPHAESLVRTPYFATGVGLLRRAQNLAKDTARGVSARAWHLVNLPAGTDLARLRAQLGALDREVRRLTVQLENERRRPLTADAPREEPDADGAQPPSGPRPRPARRGAQRPPRS